MKLSTCQRCSNVLYFENTSCEQCGAPVGALPGAHTMTALTPEGSVWIADVDPGSRYRFCRNWEFHGCNWLVEADQVAHSPYCRACQHNVMVPDLSNPLNRHLWSKIEGAKRRLFYSLLRLGDDPPLPGQPHGLAFEFLAELPHQHVMTGHDNGRITISLKEADDGEREKMRNSLGETYRTLLGHMRHEVGHYYWDRLVRDGGRLDECRAVFGDDRADYQQALNRHYAEGPPADWRDRFITPYATMHPWEDFAETWAHYLHIVDTLETARSFGMSVSPSVSSVPSGDAGAIRNPYDMDSMDELVAGWLPIVYAVNSLNRTMGQPDLYPFVLSAPVVAKLTFIRRVIIDARREAANAPPQT